MAGESFSDQKTAICTLAAGTVAAPMTTIITIGDRALTPCWARFCVSMWSLASGHTRFRRTTRSLGVDGYRDEIWALGLRNPWGFAFDSETGDFYVPDVGNFDREEVNFQAAESGGGENYGWRNMEGSQVCPFLASALQIRRA